MNSAPGNMHLDHMRKHWGERLRPVPTAKLQDFALPGGVVDFLIGIGLPVGTDKSLFPIFNRPSQPEIWVRNGIRYIVIAEERGERLCIREASGTLYTIDSRDELPTRFVNTDVPCMVKCLWVWETGNDLSSYELAQRLESIDSRVLDDPENFWSLVVEQRASDLI